ncbi:MFS general substrate transporter [Suillus weaverae]|nr:MFS general substrate transporter [Suillus weaverae]
MTTNHSDAVSISKEHDECKELDLDVEFDGIEARNKLERRLLWKLDLPMSFLVLIYIINHIDRNNASTARTRGLVTDLHLEGQQFVTLLSILYVIMQIPSNMFLNYIGKPSLYLPACMTIWGVISALTGITTKFVGALLARFFLGFVEAGFVPGAVFLISKWYKRDEIGVRLAILFCNAFGALIASGILAKMNGVCGQAAWSRFWLFYVEGALTVSVLIIAVFILPDFPTNTKWLSDDERRLVLRRMEEDAGVGDQSETKNGSFGHGFYLAIADWKVWWLAILAFAQTVALSFIFYFPSLTATLGYNPTASLLLVAPPWVYAVIFTFMWTRHSDKTQERFFRITISSIIGIFGSLISIPVSVSAVAVLHRFFMAQAYSVVILITTWTSNTFPRPPSKRAVCFSLNNAFAQLANKFINETNGKYIWPIIWGPTYRYSYAIVITSSVTAITMAWILRQHLKTLNKKLE